MNNNLKISDSYRERDLFIGRDFSSHTRRNDSVDEACFHPFILLNNIR